MKFGNVMMRFRCGLFLPLQSNFNRSMERKEKMEISFTFEEVLQQVNAAPILRKVKTYLDIPLLPQNPNFFMGYDAEIV